ncbi:MAG: methyltransferase domain-containing protein [Phycisphaerae bacterium]|jgi:SAM-dependent methyltransferase
MNYRIYKEFERICSERKASGKVLEIGAVPNEQSLLCMKSLEHTTEKVGINLLGPHTFRDFSIVKGNANEMGNLFDDDSFDVVLSNATLEHDKHFWRTVSEIHRIIRPGGLIILGVPGYREYWIDKIRDRWCGAPGLRRLFNHPLFNAISTATMTFRVHDFPGDYYRFSAQTLREVFLEGCRDAEIRSVMAPPRLIASGIKL